MNAQSSLEVMGNVEAEAALCGGLMSHNKSIDAVADQLSAEDFSDPLFGHIYSVIVREYSLGRAATPVTLQAYFKDGAAVQLPGGPGFLGQLTGTGAVVIGIKDLANQILMLARRRQLIEGLEGVIVSSQAWEVTTEELIDEADAAVTTATEVKGGTHQPSAADCIGEVLDSFQDQKLGVLSRIGSFNETLGPIRAKQLVILAGRPGMGKTAVALSYATGAAQNGHGVLFVSLEMSSTELGARMAADLCFDGCKGVPFDAINAGRVTANQRQEVARAAEQCSDLPFRVVDVGSVQIGRLNMMVRRHQRRMAAAGHKLELVVVDYLQLVRPDHRTNSAYEAVSEVSRGLKQIAKEHGVGVLALAQLSREVEKRPDKRPQLSDLRDSGQIEQDADAVMFLMRPEYYLRKDEPDADDPKRVGWEAAMAKAAHQIEFICAKRRNGPEAQGKGYFYGQFQAVRG